MRAHSRMNIAANYPGPRWGLRGLIAGLMVLVWTGVSPAQDAESSDRPRRVLILYSDERMLPAGIIVDRELRETLENQLEGAVEIHTEYLDRARFPGEEMAERQSVFLREKYAGRAPDVIVAGGAAALKFLLKFRDSLFEGVPIVHCAVADRQLPPSMPDDAIVGIPLSFLFASSLELALEVQPGIRQVAVVAGVSERDRSFVETFRKSIARFEPEISFTWLTDLAIEDLREAISRLPKDSVVLYLGMFEDAKGRTFLPQHALEVFAPASAVPIYGAYATYLGHGILGGMMVSFEEIGREAGRIAVRILDGEVPQKAVQLEHHEPQPTFDWREVERWGLDDNLPPGSIVLNREPTFWETHGNLILLAGSICLIEAALIAVLVWQIRRRRTAESLIRENEHRMNLAVESANFGIWSYDLITGEIWATAKWREIFGFGATETVTFDKAVGRIIESNRTEAVAAMTEARKQCGAYEAEFRIQLPGGDERWIASRGRYLGDSRGRAVRAMGVSRDATEQKLAEETTRDLSGRLIHAQEEAQGRLARELHDDLSQRLALLAVELEMFEQPPAVTQSTGASRMQVFSSQVKTIASDIHRLAHHLHPAKLDQLGLEIALRSFCREFSEIHQMAIRFEASNVPRSIPDDIALCLYRIAQEALHNVVKHSGATKADVSLEWENAELTLVIVDDGVGFDANSPAASSSLGVVGMEERAHFVRGRFAIQRQSQGGTRVEVRVPVAASEGLPPEPSPMAFET